MWVLKKKRWQKGGVWKWFVGMVHQRFVVYLSAATVGKWVNALYKHALPPTRLFLWVCVCVRACKIQLIWIKLLCSWRKKNLPSFFVHKSMGGYHNSHIWVWILANYSFSHFDFIPFHNGTEKKKINYINLPIQSNYTNIEGWISYKQTCWSSSIRCCT